jgi:hypothetical protein
MLFHVALFIEMRSKYLDLSDPLFLGDSRSYLFCLIIF